MIPGAKKNSKGLKVPRTWVNGILEGKFPSPDGIDRRKSTPPVEIAPGVERESQAEGGEPMPKTSEKAELLDRLRGMYGQDSDVRVELMKRGRAGYAYQMDLPQPPTKAELQTMYPEGGDFAFRIFKKGKIADESNGVIIDGIDAPYDPVAAGVAPGPRMAPGARPRGVAGGPPPGAPPPQSAGDYMARKAADVAFRTLERPHRDGDNGQTTAILNTVMQTQQSNMQQVNSQLQAEREARKEEMRLAEARRKEERDLAEQRRQEEKEELEAALAQQREEFEQKRVLEMEKFERQMEENRRREREFFERQKEVEAERSKNLIDSQQNFFTAMRELDSKREEMMEKARTESLQMQEKIFEAQREGVDEQRRANERIFNMQMEHFSEMKKSQESAQPLSLLAQAITPVLNRVGAAGGMPAQSGMGGIAQNQPGALPPGASQGGMSVEVINHIKGQQFFIDELKEAANKVKGGITPAFTVNKLMAMMQANPAVSLVLDYVVTRDIGEVVQGVNLDSETLNILTSPEGVEWWKAFREMLTQTMNATVEAQMAMLNGGFAAEGGGAAPGGGAAGGGSGGATEPPPAEPGLNQGQV
jgi:hypothetical protein